MKVTRGLLLLFVILSFALPVFAANKKPVITKEKGEEYQIRQRHEWFYSTRRAGVDQPLGKLRWQAVEQTRLQTALQKKARAGKMPAANWVSRGPSSSNFGGWTFGKVSGRTIALARDWTNNILYAGAASGGLWKSTDDGGSWTSLFDEAGTTTVGEIAIDPNNPQVLWVGTGENSDWCEDYFGIGILRSTDGGATWELRNGSGANTLEDISAFASIIVDPRDSNHLVVGGAYHDCIHGNYYAAGLYTSTDAGATWTKRLAGPVTEIVQDPVRQDYFWAGVMSMGVYRSTDNGLTWIKQTNSSLPGTSAGRIEVDVSPANTSIVYALFESGPSFWRTTNDGDTWTQMSTGTNACDGQCWYNMVVRAHPTDPNTVYRGTIHIYKSTNGGGVWTDLSGPWGSTQKVHQDTHEFIVSPTNGNILYVGCDGGVWKTTNGGTGFTNLNGNLNITQFYAIGNHPTDNGIVVGGCQDNSSLARNGSDLWEVQEVTGDGFVCHINPLNTNYVYAASYPWYGYPSVLRSTSGLFGYYDWISGSGSGIIANDRINWVTPYALDPSSPNILYLGTHRVYKSTDNGTSWGTPSGDLTAGSGSLITVEVNRAATSVLFSGSESGYVYRSTDSGGSWTNISSTWPASRRSINDIAGDPLNTSKAYAVVGGFNTAHFFVFDGTNWAASGSGLPNVPANTVIMLDSGDIYVGNDVGVFRSADGGSTFLPFMDGLPQGAVVTDLKYTDATQTLSAGTYGRGVWQIQLGACATITIAPATLPDAVAGANYSQILTAGGGSSPYTYSIVSGSLPAGLALDPSTGAITGTAGSLGTSNFTIGATDVFGCNGSASYSLRVCPAISVSPATLAAGTINVPYSQTVTATGGTGPYAYEVSSGLLPPGLSLESTTGLISGTPASSGTFNFSIGATDADGCTGTQTYSLFICGILGMSPASLPSATVGTYYSQGLAANGGTAPYTFALTAGSLPAGMSLNTTTGRITGIPSTVGTANFDITATDASSCSGTHSYSIAVCPVISITPPALPAGVVGTAYSQQLSVSGGTAPYTFSVSSGSLPAGLSLDPATGLIDGTPTAVQTANFSVTVADSTGCSPAAVSYSITVAASCLFCDDFEDSVLDPNWSYLKPTWTEAGGSLNGTPAGRKATAIASPIFAGCSECRVLASMQSAGGLYNKLWLLAWYQDKANTVELLMKQENGKWILRQRSGKLIVAKTKGVSPIEPGVSYAVEVAYSAGDLVLRVDGTVLATLHLAAAPSIGTVGFAVKNTTGSFDSILVDSN